LTSGAILPSTPDSFNGRISRREARHNERGYRSTPLEAATRVRRCAEIIGRRSRGLGRAGGDLKGGWHGVPTGVRGVRVHHKRKFYLMPIFVMMLLIGTLIVFSKGSVVAPFIYTLF
jgi:hypothetical protein